MVDMGIILCENILRHMRESDRSESRLTVIQRASVEVGGAIMTAVATTIISFLPVFTLTAAEGKLFKPVAFTKTYALASALIVALAVIPPLAHMFFRRDRGQSGFALALNAVLAIAAIWIAVSYSLLIAAAVFLVAITGLVKAKAPEKYVDYGNRIILIVALALVTYLLTEHWLPLGPDVGFVRNIIFVAIIIFGLLGLLKALQWSYRPALTWCLDYKAIFLIFPITLTIFGATIWLGFSTVFWPLAWAFEPDRPTEDGTKVQAIANTDEVNPVRRHPLWVKLSHAFPGLGKEFMPDLDEGSYLLMPTTMPHASIGEALDVLQKQDVLISNIPEVESVVGKIGRVESALDPAPISMVETIINYVPEYKTDPETGRRILDPETGGPIRNWRPEIKTPDDIWDEILKASKIPGTTSAPRLQPIAARIVMLQSGMRAPMGVKIRGKSLKEVEKVGFAIEQFLKEVPSIEPASVVADRIVGKPYLEIDIDRNAIARYGMNIRDVQDVIEIAVGGRKITTTVEGRERYPVRVRYKRELRDTVESLRNILVAGPSGTQIPMALLADIRFVRGPMVIKSEDTFLVGYVLFDKKPGRAEVDVVEEANRYLRAKMKTGDLDLPEGASFVFAGSYENQVRSEKTLSIVIPIALILIFLILYMQFKSAPTALIVFSGVFVVWSGGFLIIWLYSEPWFMDFTVFGVNMRDLFQIRAYNLSVAVWVGFLALFGIATDDGVIFCTYLDQVFKERKFNSIREIRQATVDAGMKRIRPALMTVGTTILALIPVLTSTGKGSDVMAPMALPSFGGMTVCIITVFVAPTLYCLVKEVQFKMSVGRFQTNNQGE
jgi:Cu(I)/Ag(I) efflux system membrane protein CusA/SilA